MFLSHYLSWIKFNNIRMFSEATKIDFSPITIYIGANGSGKSSVNKALLLIKRYFQSAILNPSNYDNTYWFYPVISNSKHLHPEFSSISQVVNNKDGIQKPITFSFPFKHIYTLSNFEFECCFSPNPRNEHKGQPRLTKVSCFNEKGEVLFYIDYNSIKKNHTKFLFKFSVSALIYIINDTLGETKHSFLRNSDFEDLKEKITTKKKELIAMIKLLNVESLEYELFDKMIIAADQTNNLRIFPRNKESQYNKEYGLLYEVIDIYLLGIKKGLTDQIDNIKKIDFYTSAEIELKRSFSLSENVGKILDNYHTLKDSDSIENKTDKVKNFIVKSLSCFGINAEFKSDYLGSESNERKLELIKNNIGLNVVDSGSGYGKVIPMIIKLASAYLNKTNVVVLEEPEVNLHPKLQSLIADWLKIIVDLLRINIIVETHSEYLIRKLQYLTAKGIIEKDHIQLYYFHHPDNIPHGENQIKKININEDGSLTDNFGTGFFDEADNIAIDLYNLPKSRNN